MRRSPAELLYVTSLLTFVLTWLFDTTGVFPRALPRLVLIGTDVGFYVGHLILFLLIWFVLWGLRQNGILNERWLDAIRSRQGTAFYIDLLIVMTSIICAAAAFGGNTVSPYLLCVLAAALIPAVHSLLHGQERTRRLASLTNADLARVAETTDRSESPE